MRRYVGIFLAVALLVDASATGAEVRREIAFPDLPGCRTLKCDFHMHTVFSDGLVWPTIRVDEAWREGLDAISITDHIEYQPHKEDVPTNHNRPYKLALERARQKNILLVRGTEITRETPPGHFNALFLTDVDPLDTKDLYEACQRAAEQQAFLFWDHPAWQGVERGQWGEEQTKLLEKKQLQGIEICNGDDYYVEAHTWAMEKNLTMVGNSDLHAPSTDFDRTVEDHRILTLVFAKERNLAALKEALVAGKTAVWYKNQLVGKEEYLSAMFAACVEVRPVHHRGKNTAWVEMRNRCELAIALDRTGKVGPGRIVLPPCSVSVVKIDASKEALSQGLSYKTGNFLIGPARPLEVKLAIPDAP